jgi:acyl carrier protein
VEFVDRVDDQVKIRGYRVELGEVEAALRKHVGVKQAVVLAREDERGDRRLVAYVVGRAEARVDRGELIEFVKGQLPDYMLPAAVVVMAKLPLNANGKIDRQGLPSPEATKSEYRAPRTGMEEAVAAVWEQVLQRGRIGTEENFFEIGGHSLIATQIAARLRDRLGVSIAVRMIFEHPTITALASAIDSNRDQWADGSDAAIVPASKGM